MGEIILELENIGGYLGHHKFTFKHGINYVKAPNSTGKTSLIKAIELLTLPPNMLKGKGDYMNYYADITEYASVKLIGNNILVERKFRRAGDDLIAIEGDPMDVLNAEKASLISFAVPENEVIDLLLKGKSVENYLKKFADVPYYEKAIEYVEEVLNNIQRRLTIYDRDRIRLEEIMEKLVYEKKELEEAYKKLQNMPEVPLEKIAKNEEARKKLESISAEMEIKRREMMNTQDKIEAIKEDIDKSMRELKDIESREKAIGKSIKDINEEILKYQKKIEKLEKEKAQTASILNTLSKELELTKKNIDIIRMGGGRSNEKEVPRCHACGQPISFEKLLDREKKINNSIRDYNKKLSEIEIKMRTYHETIESLKRDLDFLYRDKERKRELESKIRYKSSEIKKLEKKLNIVKQEIEDLEKEVTKIKEEIDEALWKKKEERDRLEGIIDSIEKRIERLEKEKKELEENLKDAEKEGKKYKFTKQLLQYLMSEKEILMNTVADTFEKRAEEIFSELNYKNFESIRINRADWSISIKRSGYHNEWNIKALSASERVTLGVVLLAAAKEAYLKEYPFFVLDELVTSYDPERFEKIIGYFKNLVDFVIVTKLATQSETSGKVMIEYA